jgi:hypothetical protein
MARVRLVAMVIGAVVAVGACGDDITGPHPLVEAEARLFDAMNRDDYESAGTLVGELWELHDAEPENGRNTFLLGAASLWWLAEAERPGTNGLQVLAQAIPLILESFFDVILNDEENAAGASALLGAFLFETGFDQAQGSALVDSAAAWVPEVGLFQQMHIRRFAAADDTVTASAIEAGFQFWEVCGGGPVDRDNPDFTAYVQPPTESMPQGFCWGSSRVPHGFEGSWLIFGDLLVKGGQLDAARRAYLNARLGQNYDRWKHKDQLESRLTEDLAARYASYANRDFTQWASIGVPVVSCTQCHASQF